MHRAISTCLIVIFGLAPSPLLAQSGAGAKDEESRCYRAPNRSEPECFEAGSHVHRSGDKICYRSSNGVTRCFLESWAFDPEAPADTSETEEPRADADRDASSSSATPDSPRSAGSSGYRSRWSSTRHSQPRRDEPRTDSSTPFWVSLGITMASAALSGFLLSGRSGREARALLPVYGASLPMGFALAAGIDYGVARQRPEIITVGIIAQATLVVGFFALALAE